jgi:hypothetical protein
MPMPSHADRLREFGAAALNARLPMPEGLVGPDGLPSPRRFDVYRNNVVVGLVNALAAAYPVVQRLVGDEFFRAMATYFVRRDPLASPVLLQYGESFPDFLTIFRPVAHLPYLSDVARIDRARLESYHAADAPSLAAAELARIAPGDFGNLRFALHPSLRITTSRFPALTIWLRNRQPGDPAPVDLSAGGEDTLLVRPDADVTLCELPEGGLAFLRGLQAGKSVMDAALGGFAVTPRFDMQANLTLLLRARAFTGLVPAAQASRAPGAVHSVAAT